jgi:site-specific recombinase XerD
MPNAGTSAAALLRLDDDLLSTSQLVEAFLADRIARGLSAKTLRAYRQRLYKFRDWLGPRPINRTTLRAYLAYLQDQQLSKISVAGYFRDTKTFCTWLVSEGALERNPADGLAPKVPRRLPFAYDPAHAQALLAVSDLRDAAIIKTLLDTGLRASELLQLQRTGIDWFTGRFTIIGKGNKERPGELAEETRIAIRAYLSTRTDDDPTLWWSTDSRPLTYSGLYQMLKRRAEQAEVRQNIRRLLHSFRVTFAVNYLLGGGDLKSLADLLGHTTITMAAHYAQLTSDQALMRKRQINPLRRALGHDDP